MRSEVQILSPRPFPHAAPAGALPARATTRSRSAAGAPRAAGILGRRPARRSRAAPPRSTGPGRQGFATDPELGKSLALHRRGDRVDVRIRSRSGRKLLGGRRRRVGQAPCASRQSFNAAATRSTSRRVMVGWIGSDSILSAVRSAAGKAPARYPRWRKAGCRCNGGQ